MSGALPALPLAVGPATGESRGLGLDSLPLASAPLPPPTERPPLPALDPLAAVPRPRPTEQDQPDFTDADLSAALLPLVGGAIRGLDFQDNAAFEAVLRATFRRALAEHQAGPFHDPGFAHRVLWRTQALFTSRSYDEVLSEKIRRFHVEEVYLLDRDRLSLVSYASCDPVRHATPRRVGAFARQLALRVKDEAGTVQPGFELGEGRRTFIRSGEFCHLVAVVRGELNELLKSDLDFALRRIESRFREPFRQGLPLLKELQPLLEECLLIHSPAAPASP
jgi:hypothetical protein